jgi:hypothetical protein
VRIEAPVLGESRRSTATPHTCRHRASPRLYHLNRIRRTTPAPRHARCDGRHVPARKLSCSLASVRRGADHRGQRGRGGESPEFTRRFPVVQGGTRQERYGAEIEPVSVGLRTQSLQHGVRPPPEKEFRGRRLWVCVRGSGGRLGRRDPDLMAQPPGNRPISRRLSNACRNSEFQRVSLVEPRGRC